MLYKIAIGENKYDVEVGEVAEGVAKVSVNGKDYEVAVENFDEVAAGISPPLQSMAPQTAAAPARARVPRPEAARKTMAAAGGAGAPQAPKAASAEAGAVVAPIPGRIMDIKVAVGDAVSAGQTVATMEAMKMENNIVCNAGGVVKEIRVQQNSEVATGDVIMIVE